MPQHEDVVLGIGDDCAVLAPRAHHELAVTTDTMVDGVHFDKRLSPADLAHKLVAVNLSDLAAMGAEPNWISLALTLPEADSEWLNQFAYEMRAQLERYQVTLIGGDTTRGPMTLTLTAQGQVPTGQSLRRKGARPGDLIFVSGHLGDARLALNEARLAQLTDAEKSAVELRLFRPEPRVALGIALRKLASSCIDLSDGLAVDLRHVLNQSGVGATINAEKIPVSCCMSKVFGTERAAAEALLGGDDYELCFTAPPEMFSEVMKLSVATSTPITVIGEIQEHKELAIEFQGQQVHWATHGYLHFS